MNVDGSPSGTPRHRRGPALLVGALVLALVALAACDGHPTSAPATSTAQPGAARIRMTLQVTPLPGQATANLDQVAQALRHRLQLLGRTHTEVAISGPATIVIYADATDADTLRSIAQPVALRFRRVLNVMEDIPDGMTLGIVGGTPVPLSGKITAAVTIPAPIAAKLGPAATTKAELLAATGATNAAVHADAALVTALEPFRQLNPAELAALPPLVQLYVPQVTCAKLINRPPGSIADAHRPVVACAAGSGEKMLLDVAPVGGADVAGAQAKIDNSGTWSIDVTFTAPATARWTALTSAAFHNDGNACAPAATMPGNPASNPPVCRLAIVVDNVVVSSPAIEAVLSRDALITGNFNQGQADQLAALLAGGELPAQIAVTSLQTI
jgi:preprotein translocase subunit SecD